QQFTEYIDVFRARPPLHLIGESQGLAAVQPGKTGHQAAEFGVYARPARIQELERTSWTAAGKARGKGDIGCRWRVRTQHARRCFDHMLLRQRFEMELNAARPYGPQKRARPIGNEKKDRKRRRLFQTLEKSVCRFEIEVVGRVDDTDAPSPLPGRSGEKIRGH